MIEDVTERRRLEAVRRDFVANISHELKTPVGALALLAETLLNEDDAAITQRLAERIVTESFRVGRTIEDLLELSRIESGELPRREPVPVNLVVAEAIERIRPAAEQAGIDLVVREPNRRLAVFGDRRQLVSAIYNLLDNAVKYSDAGFRGRRVRRDRWPRDRDLGARPRDRDPGPRPGAGVRAVLPGRSGPQPANRRYRTRPGDRAPRDAEPRRDRYASSRARAKGRRSSCACRPHPVP